MAAAEILATGSTAAQSSDIVVTDGTAVTVLIKGNTVYVELAILVKNAAGSYVPTGKKLTSAEVRCLQAPGTYRLARAEGVTCGADSA